MKYAGKHRLDLFRLELPPLRERRQDPARLAEALMARPCKRHRIPRRVISSIGCERRQGPPADTRSARGVTTW